MIVGIEGVVEHKEPTVVHINVSGIIYEVHISLHTSAQINDKRVKLFINHIIREDAQLLFGFSQKSEKVMFDQLIKINGVGPKVALAICSTFTPSQFASIVSSNDVNGLKKVPGIGPKSAGRILVELSGFIDTFDQSLSIQNSSHSEAVLALESLGFKKEQILKALVDATEEDTASLVKTALKKLQKL